MRQHLFVIRHGETAWSLTKQHTGRTDIPLNDHGHKQARELRSCLEPIHFSNVLTSDLARARQTCELAGFGDVARIDDAISEWNYGEYEGKTKQEIHGMRPDWNIFRDGCPGGESPEQIVARVDGVIERLGLFAGPVAIFSHGHFLRCLAARWIGLDIMTAQHLLLGTASLGILGFAQEKDTERVLVLWNYPGCNPPPNPRD